MGRRSAAAAFAALGLACGACAVPTPGGSGPRAAALADTTVCVVAPATASGLRTVAAKREVGTGRAMVEEGGELRPFEELYPSTLLAGYAAREQWFTRGQPISVQQRTYVRYGDRRRVQPTQLTKIGDYQGVLLFADPKDATPPQAVYVPAEPGCVFQPYVRQDLMQGR